ncbi:MAG: CoA synthetase [Alphaproteobacteria bacterium]|nr:CoA synthetase [Alphaproteobacteria bacterium]
MVTWIDIDAMAARIPDGTRLAVPADYSGVAMAATRALIARGARGLRLVTVPTSGMQADLLVGAGAVAEIETAGVTLGEHGLAPRFSAAAKAGRVDIRDATCPAIHAGLQAAEKGVPFMPLRGLIGSDLLAVRSDWHIIGNPFAGGALETGDDPIVLLPAIRPDVALFHARWADRSGNVWIGRRRELATMAHAAATTLVTVEERYDGDLLADETMAAGTLPALYVGAVAVAERGAWPLALPGAYAADDGEIARYAAAARTEPGFADYLAGTPRRAA